MEFDLTRHAEEVMNERDILLEWVALTIESPALVTEDPFDPCVRRYFRVIQERDQRVLRVAVNVAVVPLRVVSVFFDRGMKGKL